MGSNFVVVAYLVAMPMCVNGASLYSYVGNNYAITERTYSSGQPRSASSYFTTAMSLSGSFRVNDGLSPALPLSDIRDSVATYSFNNGYRTLTEVNSDIRLFQVATDANGNLTDWSILVRDDSSHPSGGDCNYNFATSNTSADVGGFQGCDGGPYQFTDYGRAAGAPGAWTRESVQVPHYRLAFTFSGFDQGILGPTDPVTGIIEWQAESLLAPIKALTYIELTIDGYAYSLPEVGFLEDSTSFVFGALVNDVVGIVLPGTNDFELNLSKETGQATYFRYSVASSNETWWPATNLNSQLTVIPAPPAAVDDGPIAVTEGVAQIVPVGANDMGFTSPVTATVRTAPTKGTITAISPPGPAAGMTLTYTADIGSAGADSFVYEMTDSSPAADSATVTLNISRDTDGDGVVDDNDNCTLASNALTDNVPGTSIPKYQLDSDRDGYGNACDADLNNSGLVTTADFGLLRSVLNELAAFSPLSAAADLNGSGTVTATDFAILRARINTPPGPSGPHP